MIENSEKSHHLTDFVCKQFINNNLVNCLLFYAVLYTAKPHDLLKMHSHGNSHTIFTSHCVTASYIYNCLLFKFGTITITHKLVYKI